MGVFFRTVARVGRATTFCVGLAVVLAGAFGVGTTAPAAVPGDPFKLEGSTPWTASRRWPAARPGRC